MKTLKKNVIRFCYENVERKWNVIKKKKETNGKKCN